MTFKDVCPKSMPRNPLLFGNMHRMELVENIGSGFIRMRDVMTSQGHEIPIVEANGEWFTIRFQRPNVGAQETKVGEKVGEPGEIKVEEKLTPSQQRIVQLMAENPRISAKELAAKIGISSRKIESNIAKLRAMNRIKRIGPTKGGYCEVIN